MTKKELEQRLAGVIYAANWAIKCTVELNNKFGPEDKTLGNVLAKCAEIAEEKNDLITADGCYCLLMSLDEETLNMYLN